MAATEQRHWWYAATRTLLAEQLGPFLPAGGRFLDAGGGTGATGAWLAGRGRLVAADLEPAALPLLPRGPPGRGWPGRRRPRPAPLRRGRLRRGPVASPCCTTPPWRRRRRPWASWPGWCAPAASSPSWSPVCAACAGPTTARPTPGAGSLSATSAGSSSTTGWRSCGPPAPSRSWCRRRRCSPSPTATESSSDLDRDQRGLGGVAARGRRAPSGPCCATSGRRSGCRSWPIGRVRA